MRRPTNCVAFPIAALGIFALAATAPAAALAAEDCPNDELRVGASANLPSCRAYERVSPADPNVNRAAGVGVAFTPMVTKARADGERVMFTSAVAVGTAERAGYNGLSLSRRTDDGWTTFAALTAAGEVDFDLAGQAPSAPYPSADLSRIGFRTLRGLGGPNPGTNGGGSTYLSVPGGVGAPTWLSQPTVSGAIPTSPAGTGAVFGGSPDLSTAYFSFEGKLTDRFGDGSRTRRGLYMYREGTLSPAGRLPSGNVDPGGALPAATGNALANSFDVSASAVRPSVSRDGSRLFFVTPYGAGNDKATVRQLYLQQDGEPGRLISKDQSGNPATAGVVGLGGTDTSDAPSFPRANWAGPGFALPTSDGTAVIFRSASVLAPGAPVGSSVKTYRARITDEAITMEYLAQVTGLPLAVSEDASRVLFVGGDSTIKLWDERRTDGAPYSLASPPGDAFQSDKAWIMNVRMTPDGSTVTFDSSAEIVPGLTMPGNTTTQVYRWVIGDTQPTCVSCRSDGQPFGLYGASTAHLAGVRVDNVADVGGGSPDLFNQGTFSQTQGISDDGRRVFFDTIDPLDPARDTNDQRDVYLWEAGRVHLLTSGKGNAPSFLLDSSATGDDVFFTTMDALVPEDVNQDYDVYDARVGGGFTPKMPPSCTGDGCQGHPGAVPNVTTPTSSLSLPVTVGVKSLLPVPAKKDVKLRVTRGTSTRTGVVLRVRTPGAGRIRARGRGVKTLNKKAKRATTYTVKAKLTASARKALSNKGQVTVRVNVRFTPTKGKAVSKTVSVRMRRAVRTNGKGR